MRKSEAPPTGLLESLQQQAAPADDWTTYPCELVTPLYGGGVTAGVVDRQMPIRASAIRGQLRFWWRVSQRRRFMKDGRLDSQAMFWEETNLWGGIGKKKPTASKVAVRVMHSSTPQCEAAFVYKLDTRPDKSGQYRRTPEPASWVENYSLFSAQGELTKDSRSIKDMPKELALAGITFTLAIRLDEQVTSVQRSQVETALRWWATFGGIGARTRRGVGALKVESIQPVTESEVLLEHGLLKVLPAETNASNAWKKAVSRLKDFRQGVDVGRNERSPGSTSPAGRSRWPEADTIRTLTDDFSEKHKERLVQGDVFPRSAFGLPIVFHFNPQDKGDPADHVLEPANVSPEEKRDRMASPLILRPYWNGKAWQPAALLLPGWEAALTQPLKFKDKSYTPEHWPADPALRKKHAADIRPMQGRGDDPLSAFMKFFMEAR